MGDQADMSQIYTTIQGDVLDKICLGAYGITGATEQVLKANPSLARKGAVYESGIKIILPDIEITPSDNQITLW